MNDQPHPRDPSVGLLTTAIEDARARCLSVLASMDATTATTPVAEGRWSPVQYLEHLVRAEEATLWRMFGVVEEAAGGRTDGSHRSLTPGATVEDIITRTWRPREESPPLAVPTLGGPRAYWMARMARNGALVSAFVDVVGPLDLDALAFRHPISGPLTLRQGLDFIRFHIDRHLDHIRQRGAG